MKTAIIHATPQLTTAARSRGLPLILLITLLAIALPVLPQETLEVTPLSPIDRQYMSDQRGRIDELARIHLGQQINGDRINDMDILQKLLDRKLVSGSDTQELQAMGIVLGDLIAEELNMDWVVYTDKLGRSRALTISGSEFYLFPVTMISRRAEADARVNIVAVYNKAYNLARPHAPKLPFQYED